MMIFMFVLHHASGAASDAKLAIERTVAANFDPGGAPTKIILTQIGRQFANLNPKGCRTSREKSSHVIKARKIKARIMLEINRV